MESPSRAAMDTFLGHLDPVLREPIIRFLVAPTSGGWEQVQHLHVEPHRTVGQTVVMYGLATAGAVPSDAALLDALMPFSGRGHSAAASAMAA